VTSTNHNDASVLAVPVWKSIGTPVQ